MDRTQFGGKMIPTKLRPIFKVDFSAKKDDHFAFRHCRIEERDGFRLAPTFTGKVPRPQSTRKHAKQDIAPRRDPQPTRLPKAGCAAPPHPHSTGKPSAGPSLQSNP